MLLVVYFDIFRKNLVKRLKENHIEYDIVKYDNLEKEYDNLTKEYDRLEKGGVSSTINQTTLNDSQNTVQD